MRKFLYFALVFLLATTYGCLGGQSGDSGVDSGDSAEASAPDPFQGAETLAKRAVVYKLAFQEGDLAAFTITPEETGNYTEITELSMALNFNEIWWEYEWEGMALEPLPSTVMARLETEVKPYISARIDASGENEEWVEYTLGYNPELVRLMIANAHTDWVPEERELFLGGSLPDCIQVWCVKVNGEWKLLTQVECMGDVTPPDAPPPPEIPEIVPDDETGDEEAADDGDQTADE